MSTRKGKRPNPKRGCGNCHPLVRQFAGIVEKKRLAITEVAERAGVAYSTLSQWRFSRNPRLDSFEAALNAVGYRLKITRVIRRAI